MYASDDLRLSEFYKSVLSLPCSPLNRPADVVQSRGRYHVAAHVIEESLSSLYSSQNGDAHNEHPQLGHDLGVQVTQVVSPDTTLTAFCQLAAIRLGVQRCGISLISRYQQYILAESTRTTNLNDTTKSDDPEDSLWMGMTEVSLGNWTLCTDVLLTFQKCERRGGLCENTVALPPALRPKYRLASLCWICETLASRTRHMSRGLRTCDSTAGPRFRLIRAPTLALSGFWTVD